MISKTSCWMMATLCVCAPLAHCFAGDRYVVKGNPGAAAPYESWATAAGDIQTAVDAAYEGEPVWVRSSAQGTFLAQRPYRSVGDTVWVRAGVYDAGGRVDVSWRAKLTNRVVITKAVVVRSEHNDPANTIIKGAWSSNGQTNGPDAVRCVYMVAGSALIGFTLTNGATLTTNEVSHATGGQNMVGGGIFAADTAATISNCVIAGNAGYGDSYNGRHAGGAHCGTYHNCVVIGNRSRTAGGGVGGHSVLFDCVVAGNSAGGNGGGVSGGALFGCVVSNNSSGGEGGGAYGGSLHGCRLVNNRAARHGGGAAVSDGSPQVVLADCVLAFNHAGVVGGGARFAFLDNCLVVSNTAAVGGAGVIQSSASNSVFIGNIVSRSSDFNNCLFVRGEVESLGNMKHCTFVGCRGSGFTAYAGKTSELYSCISWSNGAVDAGAIKAFNSCGAGNLYTNTLLGNTTNNPLFVDYGAGNYRLQANSPCAHAGFKRGQ